MLIQECKLNDLNTPTSHLWLDNQLRILDGGLAGADGSHRVVHGAADYAVLEGLVLALTP